MAKKDTRPLANIIRTHVQKPEDDWDWFQHGWEMGPWHFLYHAYDVADGNRLIHTYRTSLFAPPDDEDPFHIDNGLSVIGALMESMGYRITTPLRGPAIDRTLRRFRRALRHNQEAQLEIEREGLRRMGQQELAQHGVRDAFS